MKKELYPMLTFEAMDRWSVQDLRKKRNKLREELSAEIQKRDALKAEIMFLEKRIYEFRKGSKEDRDE